MLLKNKFTTLQSARSQKLLMAFAILLAIPSMTPARQNGKPEMPALEVDSTQYNLGDIFVGEEISHIFSIRNTGTAPLKLSDTPFLSGKLERAASWRPISVYKTISTVSFRLIATGTPPPT